MTEQSPPTSGPSGIGGWLILMSIGQVLGPIQLLAGMVEEYGGLPAGTIGRVPLAFIGDLLLRLALIGFLIYTAWLFFNRRSEFPRVFIQSVAATLLLPFAVALWITLTSGVNTLPNLLSADFVRNYAFALAISGVWVAYVLNSVRVRNTFVE